MCVILMWESAKVKYKFRELQHAETCKLDKISPIIPQKDSNNLDLPLALNPQS